jgi:toxin ParE1/3/4
MKFQIKLIDFAEAELWEAIDFYDAQKLDLGKAFAREFGKTINLIRKNPKQFPKIYKTRRRAVVQNFPFAVFYDILDDTIFIISIFHSRRDPKIW